MNNESKINPLEVFILANHDLKAAADNIINNPNMKDIFSVEEIEEHMGYSNIKHIKSTTDNIVMGIIKKDAITHFSNIVKDVDVYKHTLNTTTPNERLKLLMDRYFTGIQKNNLLKNRFTNILLVNIDKGKFNCGNKHNENTLECGLEILNNMVNHSKQVLKSLDYDSSSIKDIIGKIEIIMGEIINDNCPRESVKSLLKMLKDSIRKLKVKTIDNCQHDITTDKDVFKAIKTIYQDLVECTKIENDIITDIKENNSYITSDDLQLLDTIVTRITKNVEDNVNLEAAEDMRLLSNLFIKLKKHETEMLEYVNRTIKNVRTTNKEVETFLIDNIYAMDRYLVNVRD